MVWMNMTTQKLLASQVCNVATGYASLYGLIALGIIAYVFLVLWIIYTVEDDKRKKFIIHKRQAQEYEEWLHWRKKYL